METSLKIKYAQKVWDAERDYVSGLVRQTGLAKNIGRISPMCLYDNTMSALAGTALGDFQSWAKTASTYRDSLMAYIRDKTDNLRSVLYFTQSTEADRVEFEKCPESRMHELANRVKQRETPLNLEDLPRFMYSTGVTQGLHRAAIDLLLLFVFNILFYSLSFVAFQKYDVR
jgi:hypothetical protein